MPKFPRLTLYKHNSREQGWLIINIMKATCFKSETTVSNDFPPLFVTIFCGIFYPFISIPVSFGTYRSLSYKLHAKALFCLLLLWYQIIVTPPITQRKNFGYRYFLCQESCRSVKLVCTIILWTVFPIRLKEQKENWMSYWIFCKGGKTKRHHSAIFYDNLSTPISYPII